MQLLGLQHPHVAFTWQGDDQGTKDWYPQGITGLRMGETKKFVVVSWYAKHEDEHKGVRLSFVDVTDMSKIRYRHVLLVEPSATATVFKPIKIHAGRLATIGSTIFVADTGYGIRAFDATHIFAAESDPGKTRVGIAGGKAYAFDYRYILPQVAKYEMNGPPFSFADIDWTDPNAPQLLTGTYHNPKEDSRPNALVWWKLEGDRIVDKLRDTRDEGLALKNLMQGAAALKGALYLSCSGRPAHFYVARSPYATFRTYAWPYGTEDLHVALKSGNLWALSEHPDKRRVWAVKLANYVP
jgi:hypothetical protein